MTTLRVPDELIEQGESRIGGNYSIRVASRMTGIAVDTLRMWERRYDFPSPNRNSLGVRIYSDTDIDRLRLVALAMKLGCRAGEAIRLSVGELVELTANQPTRHTPLANKSTDEVERILSQVRSGQIDRLRWELRRITGLVGARHFVLELVDPLLQTVGSSWAEGKLAVYQEHLLTNLLTTHLRSLIQQHQSGSGPDILLATLPREQHALGLDMAALLASLTGARVQVLGADSPPAEIVQAATALAAQAVALSISTAVARTAAEEQVKWLAEHLPTPLGLWLGGKGARLLENLPARVRVIETWHEFEVALEGLARGL